MPVNVSCLANLKNGALNQNGILTLFLCSSIVGLAWTFSHPCVMRHNLCGMSASCAPLGFLFFVFFSRQPLSYLDWRQECKIMPVFTTIPPETDTEGDVATVCQVFFCFVLSKFFPKNSCFQCLGFWFCLLLRICAFAAILSEWRHLSFRRITQRLLAP